MIQSETLTLLEWPRLCQHLATFAATKLGAMAATHLKLPETQAESVQLLAQTTEVQQLEADTPTGLKFDGVRDIGEFLERAELQGLLPGEALLEIATTLSGARQLRRLIEGQPELPTLKDLVANLRTYPELEKEIHRCIEDDGQVADRASPKLAEVRVKRKQLRDQIYQTLQRLVQRQGGALQEQLITQRGDRFVLPVKAPQKDAIPGIVHDTSTSGATLYIEPHAVVNLGNQLRQVQRREQAEVEAICRALTEQVAEVTPDLERLLIIVTTLDLATARARYSSWLGANPPRFLEADSQSPITLRQLRHPLLVWQQQHEQAAAVVPVDLIIQSQIRVVAITGPNTGGKTVTLKTLGLAALMAKAGLYIPAREPVEIPWFDQILADIGDEQSLEQNLSTFSGHIRRIGRILEAIGDGGDGEVGDNSEEEITAVSEAQWPSSKTALSNSLVLFDEVGAGTDPSEGSALAIALLKHLADHVRLAVATTHFGELKALKYQDERFENASVEFDDVSLSPTYRLLWGIPGRSNALIIARRLGLNPGIVDHAAQLGVGGSEDINQVIAGLEAQRRRQESQAEDATQLVRQAEKLHAEVARKAAALRKREQELQQRQEKAIQDAIVQAKSEIAQVIRQLQQGPAKAQSAQKATEKLNQLADRHLPKPKEAPRPANFQPKVGDRIRIPRLDQTAEVLSSPDEDGDLMVRFGIMKMTVRLGDIESLTGEKAEPAKPKVTAQPATKQPQPPAAPAIRTSQNTVDLRGKRVGEAEVIVERAIATAQGPLWIIHGHGTGKLRRGVHEFLDRHPQIQRHEFAEQADGGKGVTVAHLN